MRQCVNCDAPKARLTTRNHLTIDFNHDRQALAAKNLEFPSTQLECIMHKVLLLRPFLALIGVTLATTVLAGPPAKISDLDWMTGNWAGALGPNQLEENWIGTEGGSLASMVRMTGNGSTSMFEVITIEEVAGSLVLHIQQFNPGFEPRTPAAQEMELTAIGENSVHFTALSEGGMKSLGYSNPNPNTFIIHVEQASGAKLDINLSKRKIW
jgi:hypothetical protein